VRGAGHLPGSPRSPRVENWTDVRIGQCLEINISLTIAKS